MRLRDIWNVNAFSLGVALLASALAYLARPDALAAIIIGAAGICGLNIIALCRQATVAVLVLASGTSAHAALGFVIAGAFFAPAFAAAAVAGALSAMLALVAAVLAQEEGAPERTVVLFLATLPLGIGVAGGGAVLLARHWLSRPARRFAMRLAKAA